MKRESKKVITDRQIRAHELIETQGKSYRDAADIMDISVSTVYEHLNAYRDKKEDYKNIFVQKNEEYEPKYITERQKSIYLNNIDNDISDYEKHTVKENLKIIRSFWRNEFKNEFN